MRIRLTWIFGIVLGALVLVSNSAWEQHNPLVAETLFALATVFVAVGALGRLWCSLYIAGYKQNTLITCGPYSMCRNPLYFFSFVGAVGVGLASESLTIPLLLAIAFAVYYPQVIRREESLLREQHGDVYLSYSQSVPRFFPRLAFTEPATYPVQTIVFRRHILSAAWFVLLLGVLEMVEALHEQHYLPVFFSFY